MGKHPRISQGRNGATTDPDIIRRWWEVWPQANIGIATGVESGLVVLDVDEDGENSLVGRDIPDTVEQITGSGGRHVLFSRPAPTDHAHRYRTRVRILPGIDSRADGGYIVAPPSLHASGHRYEWEASSSPFDDATPSPAPEWFIELIQAPALDETMARAPEWNPDGELPSNILDMLSAIPADEYETWRDVGMALHYTDPVDGMAVWDWWSSTSPKYNGDAVRQEWRNFSRRQHTVANPVTMSSIRRLAEQHGWIDPDIEHGAEVAGALMESHQRRQAEQIKARYQKRVAPARTTAPDVMPSSGLIRDIATRIIATSIRPQPMLAVMAATAFVATLAGRKYQTETGLRTNLYIVGLAESGSGKDHARKEINNLALAAGVDHHIGGDRIASGPGIVSALDREPSRLFMLDEIGHMLQAMMGQRADGHKRDMMATLMTLYSAAGSVYRGAEYADQRDRPRQDLVNPNACLYGTSTPASFYAALTSSQGVDGTLSRLIVATSPSHRPERQRPDLSPVPQSLADAVRALAEYSPHGGNLSAGVGGRVGANAQVVTMAPGIWEAWEALDDDMDQYMIDGPSRSVYSRVAENAAKLALVYAVSINHQAPRIDADALHWGREVALWGANTMMSEVARNVADNEIEGEIKRVLSAICDAGEITRRELLRRVRTIRKRDLEGIVERLIESGEVVVEQKKPASGRPSTVYRCVDA